MSPTFAQSAAARDADWIAIVELEGNAYRYCSERPSYADSSYRDWLLDWPHVSPERVDVLGGLPQSGELEIALLDYQDFLTSEWRIEGDPATYLNGAIDGAVTSLIVDSASGISTSSILFIGNEAMTVTSVVGTTIGVGRGKLNTDATPHRDGDPIYLYLPYLHSRLMRLKVVNKDAANSGDETLVGDFRVDQFALTEDMNGYVLRGKSQLKWLSRLAARRPKYRTTVTSFRTGAPGPVGSGTDFDATPMPDVNAAYGTATALSWNGTARVYLRNESTDEIFVASSLNQGTSYIWNRAQLGTRVGDIAAGNILRLVWGADPSDSIDYNPSWFRYSPGPSPSNNRATGTWTKSAQWIDLLLNLAVSSADPADGLALNNRNAAYGAWDALLPGIGIGVPHTQIDWAAALDVRSRTPDYLFPNFYVDEAMPFGDLITLHFLKPLGAYLSTVGGLARVILPRVPLAGSSAITIGPSEFLARPIARGVYAHRMGASQDMSDAVSSIVYVLGNGDRIIINNADYLGTYGQAGYYAHEEKTLEIQVPSVRGDPNGRSPFLEDRAASRLLRVRRPYWHLTPPVDYSQYAAGLGDALSITHAEMPDLSRGTRGWTSVFGEITQIGFKLDPAEGLHYDWEAISWGPNFRVGKIAPSARVSSAAAVGGGPIDITVAANRYTQPDALGALPTTDAAAFAVGDVVKLYNRNGTAVSATTQLITAIAGNVIRVSGNFGGALAAGAGNAGQTLRYASSAGSTSQQTTGFVYWADQVDRTIGAGAQTPWKYGEP